MIEMKTTPIKFKGKKKALLFSLLLSLSLSQPIFAQEKGKAPTSDPQTTESSIQNQKKQKEIEKLIQAKRYPKAYKLARQLQSQYPGDLNDIYLLAYIEKNVVQAF